MAWQSMASPAIFAIIADSLSPDRRAMGFTVQSILKRIPIVVAPMIGGALIARHGIARGIHVGIVITTRFGGRYSAFGEPYQRRS